MKKGYRLTPEEEAILRGEIPPEDAPAGESDVRSAKEGQVAPPDNSVPPLQNNENKKPGSGRAVKSILPVLLALAMMIAIAYLFMWLVNTPERRARQSNATPESEQTAPSGQLPEEQKSDFTLRLGLTGEESALFWPVYSRFCAEMTAIREKHEKWLAEQTSPQTIGESFEDFTKLYTSVYKELEKTTRRFAEAFAAVLDEERVPEVLFLYERWNGCKPAPIP